MKEDSAEGPTPAGGAYSRIFYLNDDHELVEKEDATRAEIIEYDENDKQIRRTYMERTKEE